MISILDYGMGNIHSIQNALYFLGFKCKIITTPAEVNLSEKIILPGVGSFHTAMENLKKMDIVKPLNKFVLEQKPILGICLGMQLLAEKGAEDGPTEGLGWIKGDVTHFPNNQLKTPHIGFNTVYFNSGGIFANLSNQADFYFVHSYKMMCKDKEDITGWCEYGEKFVAAVQHGNIFGVQFHPEKSQSNGLIILKNFCELKC